MFDFVNNYISLYMLAFWERSLAQLAQNLMTFIAVKQFIGNGITWVKDSVITRLKIKRIEFIYDKMKESDKQNADQYEFRKRIECNIQMKKPQEFIGEFYLEHIK